MAIILKPPSPIEFDRSLPSVFLAGSIEMGRAAPWQTEVEHALALESLVILNPRRDEWDATWEQSIQNPNFRQQVEWELAAQEQADLVAFYFAPDTKSPITLLELGLMARSGKAIVCCPDGYWRRGNIEVVCARFEIPLLDHLNTLIELVRRKLRLPTD